jgi:hypothetical protein
MPDYQPHTVRQTAEYSAPTFKENSAPVDIIAWLRTRPAEREVHEIAAYAHTGKAEPPMAIRLIVRRKTAAAIAKAHQDLHRQASRKQTRLDPRSLVAAAYLVLATSLPAAAFPAAEVLAAYRLRWRSSG